jgi:hypothetical protein
MDTTRQKIGFGVAKLVKSLARPEGFEPPTLRSEVRLKAKLHQTTHNTSLLIHGPPYLNYILFRPVTCQSWY